MMVLYALEGGIYMSFDRTQYNIDYIKANQRQFMLKVNRNIDPDMVAWLESKDNVQAYLKELIRADMEKQKAST